MVLFDTILPFVGILVGLVVVHELGHFAVAKLSGVRVEEFGVGMPPRIWGKRFGETLYSFNWLPLGGFVRLTGEESARVAIAAVNTGNAADRAGLRVGDVVTQVNGEAVHSPEQLAAHLRSAAAKGPYDLTIERPGSGERAHEVDAWDFTLEAIAPDATRAGDDSSPRDESPDATAGRIAGLSVSADPRSLGSKPRWLRILVLAAGAGVNAVLPIVLFAIAAMIPQDVPAGPATVASVISGAPADLAGLEPGDRILAVNGEAVRNTGDLSLMINLNLSDDIELTVERPVVEESLTQRGVAQTETFTTTVHVRLAPEPLRHTVQPGEDVHNIGEILGVPASAVLFAAGLDVDRELSPGLALEFPGETYVTQPDDTIASIAREVGVRTQLVYEAAGIDPLHPPVGSEIAIRQGATGISISNGSLQTVSEREGVFRAVGQGWDRTLETLELARNRIRSWIAGGEGIQVAGPVGIARVTGEVVEQAGWIRLIELAALLSLNLAIINLLPLPMLDGGRIVFVLIEIARRGKRISPEKEGLVHLAGFAALILFVVIISYFDIVRAVNGESAIR